ncbi:acetyl-CoA synthetase-like protein [Pleurotus eryngii]|uniref:Acetyl-CoA synthetase-like protein n=1 Tax=Pleurotus eryngii TaxID=5323 RepID=A0A9P6A2N2_PLEER|nr:acetyl-CoA synthetase-like protein [Pleurotus eryngii]
MSPRLPLPPLPKTQALTSSTFKIPPLDGSLSVPELYDWHYCHKTEHPVFEFPGENDQQTIIKWPELVRAIHTGARIIRNLLKSAVNPSVIAIFTTSETFTYFTLIAATFRAGFVPFLISHRNSTEALAFLFSETDVDHVLVDRGTELQEVLRGALRLMQETYPRAKIPPYSEVPLFEELFRNEDSFRLLPPYRPDMDTLAMILHSSVTGGSCHLHDVSAPTLHLGSTAYPKAIRWAHMQTLQLGFVPYFGERDLTGSRLSCHAMPMSHGTGMMQTAWTASMGIVITAATPKSPGIPPTPSNVIDSAQATSTDIIFCVPMYIETWSHDPRTVDFLSNIDGLLFYGALLNKDIGDMMTRKGVSIFNLYGCAEVGIISPIIPWHSSLDWEYFTVSNQMEWKLIPNGLGQNRLAIMPTLYHTPLVVNDKVDGKDATFTDDLFIAHPTKRGYFKLFGRVDDQIEHATGEITNPVPIENLLNQDPHIRASVIFGHGQFNLGVMVDPTQSFDPHDVKQLAEFRNAIWPTIERVNKIAPRHSHLLKEMILIALPTKPLEYTAKNTARRQRIIAHYKAEIDALYQEANLCQGTLVTNTIVKALRDTTRATTNDIANTSLDHHTSIDEPAAFCVKFAAKASYLAGSVDDYQIIVGDMEEMLERFGSNFTERSGCFTHKGSNDDDDDDDDVFLVTGTTGFFGATLFGHLLQSKSKNTRTVYAVISGDNGGVSLASRQKASIRQISEEDVLCWIERWTKQQLSYNVSCRN